MKTTNYVKTAAATVIIATLFFSSLSRAASFLELSDIESALLVHENSSCLYGRCFRFMNDQGDEPYWGHIFDRENRFYDKGSGRGALRIQSFLYSDCIPREPRCGAARSPRTSLQGLGGNAQTGDNLFITYDGGQKKHVYLPPLSTFTELYVGSDGSTYYDAGLTQTAQEALPPTPTPTLTPEGYLTPSPTPGDYCGPSPTTAPTCSCCPSTDPRYVSLSEQTRSAGIIYDSTYGCIPDPANLMDWWTSCTDWIEVTPARGFGIDGQVYSISIALGNTSSLSPGWHRSEIISFHDLCNFADVSVDYYKATPPTPAPTSTPSPAPSPSPTVSCDFTLSGHVVNAVLYENIPGAEVRLAFADGQSNLATTDENGAYSFAIFGDHPPGTITGEARRRGYIPGYRWNDVSWDCQTAIENFDFQLTPLHERAGIASSDYNGDGTSDIAVFRPNSALWAVRNLTRLYFGSEGDELAPGDYDGDGTTEAGIFRPSAGFWAIRGLTRLSFGRFLDLPVPNDYVGDGTCRVGIFRPWSGMWAIFDFTRLYWGVHSPLSVPSDYDGNGTTDVAYFEMDRGQWRLHIQTTLYWGVNFYFGTGDDFLLPGDYDGNGTGEAGIFRPSSGLWAVHDSTRFCFGTSADHAVLGDYNGDRVDDAGIFRDSSGLWSVRDLTQLYFGSSGDIPVTR